MARRKEDQDFLQLVSDRNLLSPEQIEALTAQQRLDARNGVRKSLLQIGLERRFFKDEELEDIETDLWISNLPDRLDDYELTRCIGRGGMAAVFEARDVSLGKTVALKILLPQFAASAGYLARFHREARLAARLTHHHSVQVFRAGNQADVHFLVMEYVDGDSVSEMVQQRSRLTEAEALDITLGIAQSLAEAHELGIVHRDVKPSNILISRWGVVKLTDFGIAKQISDIGDTQLRRSITLGVIGTPQYMSPEQVRGAKDIDFRTDIYSLGASLYHMLVGKPPFSGQTAQEAMLQVTSGSPQDPRAQRADLSDATCNLVARMMATDRNDRFATFDELIGAIEHARGQVAGYLQKRSRKRRLAPRRAKTPTGEPSYSGPIPLDEYHSRQNLRPARILFTAGFVVVVGAFLLFGLPRIRSCRRNASPASPPRAAPSDFP